MYSWLWSYVKKYRLRFLAGILLALGVSALNLANPAISGIIVDKVIIGGRTSLLWVLLGFMLGVTVLKLTVRFAYQISFEHISQNVMKTVREDLFEHLQRLDFGYFDTTKTGDIMAQMTGDLDAVRHFLAWVVYQCVENSVIFLASATALFFVNWKFTLVLLSVSPFIGLTVFLLARDVKPTFSRIREQFSRLNSVVQENIAGNRIVKAFVREDHEIAKFERENTAFRERNIESAAVWGKYIPLIEFFSGLLSVVMVLAGGIMIIRQSLSLGEFVIFSGLVWALNNPMRMAGWLINDIQRFAASCERIFSLSRTRSRLEDARNNAKFTDFSGRVEFENVTFSYGDEEVLSGVSFTAEKGTTVGILGPTGSGKSSLVKLICRYYDPTHGRVLLDGTDVRDIPLSTLRSQVGIAMQDVFLFSDTIEGNVAFGVPDAPVEDVIEAAVMANAHDFVGELPQGYDTIIGERGVGLSGGQRQRLALARLLLKNPPVLILDDTTSSVDIETEARIQASIRALHGTRTMFIVAHRISSIMHADEIFVLQNGHIVQRGTHERLIREDGYYRTVYIHQTGSGNGAK